MKLEKQLEDCRQLEGESLTKFAFRLRELIIKDNPDFDENHIGRLWTRPFLSKISPQVAMHLRLKMPFASNFSDILSEAVFIENLIEDTNYYYSTTEATDIKTSKAAGTPSVNSAFPPIAARGRFQRRFRPPPGTPPPPSSDPTVKCYACGFHGHMAYRCVFRPRRNASEDDEHVADSRNTTFFDSFEPSEDLVSLDQRLQTLDLESPRVSQPSPSEQQLAKVNSSRSRRRSSSAAIQL